MTPKKFKEPHDNHVKQTSVISGFVFYWITNTALKKHPSRVFHTLKSRFKIFFYFGA